jgi:F-type H+-transporting ATPase subunit a
MQETIAPHLPYLVIVNLLVVSAVLIGLGAAVTTRPLKELPEGRQNAAELVLEWFVTQARNMDPGSIRLVAPFLATLFLLILGCNLLALLPVPLLKIPPTAYFSVPLALALIAVLGGLVMSAMVRGVGAALKHLIWPNPLQLVGEVSHTLSLSLRLYGNIAAGVLVAALAAQAAPYGLPLVIDTLELIPAVVQPIVFTLLTASFLAAAVSREERPGKGGDATASHKPGSPLRPESGRSR